ncbi:hypothetical protein P171DRAFT_159779 [Karstenula rhodostoma CBS 690.94]|uniref:Secreted protein n=1 Tax=Karstenula rhodostoma CBS 690.94 TaxID=1392251 RepID=A0A9P4U5T0_9PLEO|nr:hypothetical protein P171DRAFT_159779 [Karstenula rhodostoma CBS 690.94]
MLGLPSLLPFITFFLPSSLVLCPGYNSWLSVHQSSRQVTSSPWQSSRTRGSGLSSEIARLSSLRDISYHLAAVEFPRYSHSHFPSLFLVLGFSCHPFD